jgi:hypothetical protein
VNKLIMSLGFLVLLGGCAIDQPKMSQEERNALKTILILDEETLPENKHLEIIGVAQGKYGTTYGNPSEMIYEMKVDAVRARGDALLPYRTTRQYISITDTTVITGESGIVVYVEPSKELVLADYSKGLHGGLLAVSAARFVSQYDESREISERILRQAKLCKCSGYPVLDYAFRNLMAQDESKAIDTIFDFIRSETDKDALTALRAISQDIGKSEYDTLIRLMKHHVFSPVKLEAARILVSLGFRSEVEEYADTLDHKMRKRFSEILL